MQKKASKRRHQAGQGLEEASLREASEGIGRDPTVHPDFLSHEHMDDWKRILDEDMNIWIDAGWAE